MEQSVRANFAEAERIYKRTTFLVAMSTTRILLRIRIGDARTNDSLFHELGKFNKNPV